MQLPCGTILAHVHLPAVGDHVLAANSALSVWKETAEALGLHGGPDLVIASFNVLETPSKQQHLITEEHGFSSESYLNSWNSNMSSYVETIKIQFPDAAVGWHTTPQFFGARPIHLGHPT